MGLGKFGASNAAESPYAMRHACTPAGLAARAKSGIGLDKEEFFEIIGVR